MISGKTKVYGVIGDPIAHTMSPMMQNLYLEKTGNDGVYVAFHVKEENLGAMVAGASAMNVAGVNVTVPHKQHVMDFLRDLDRSAAAIGAVNTLVPVEGGYKGYNTDAAGLARAMKEQGISIRGQECILLGAGGAAKAAAYMLASEGAALVYVLNRSREKAVALSEDLNRLFGRKILVPMALEDYHRLPKGSYLAIQSTSVGMAPHADQALIEDPEFYQMIHTGVDIVYTPAETKFMRYVKEAGGKVMNGLDMLIYQGVIAYELWNPDRKISEDTIEEARRLMKENLSKR